MKMRESAGETATATHAARSGQRYLAIQGNALLAHATRTRCAPKLNAVITMLKM
jgi:hypothetical protein